MKRRDFAKAVAAAGATLAASQAIAGPATTGLRSNFAFKKEDTPVILEVAINGSATKKVNPTAPETPAEIAEQAIQCLDAGATIVHAHSNQPMEDPDAAAQVYIDAFSPVREKHPDAILYPTANFDPKVYHQERRPWKPEIQSGHYRKLAEAGAANMLLFDTGVVPIAVFDEQGKIPEKNFWWYGFWPGDAQIYLDVCNDLGTGASISVFEPGWMKNVVALARAGTLPPRVQGHHVLRRLRLGWYATTHPGGLAALSAHDRGAGPQMVGGHGRRRHHGYPACPHGPRAGGAVSAWVSRTIGPARATWSSWSGRKS